MYREALTANNRSLLSVQDAITVVVRAAQLCVGHAQQLILSLTFDLRMRLLHPVS
ncbi:unnamed protein product [Fusarium venenatum]|uniref:Uncharacterized protein n=1 Tax=Fusarium venenatum TaxID=56646 RepID=A0A2L2TUX9_9HYPO|nr:uncharacterized protein FVRRES_00617 [Fusarium venenatum]CEI64105.1 unnamed protein product [Fusarium venenatum]